MSQIHEDGQEPGTPHMIELPILNDPGVAAERSGDRERGPMLWRHLEEYARGGAGVSSDLGEFADPGVEVLDDASRRDFLKYMGASLALGGISGCAYQPPEAVVPYVQAPELLASGKPIYFASALTHMGFATGVLVKSAMGRPVKVEGNPDHPASLGATDLFAQADMLGLYDPDRSQTLLHSGRVEIWERLQTALLDAREKYLARKGAGLRFLTQTVASATLQAQFANLLKTFPEAKWHAYESVSRDSVRAGSTLAYGEVYESLHHIERANVIAAFDSDFLVSGPGRIKDARAFSKRRDVDAPGAAPMNRLYVFESTPSVTGGSADHRSPVASYDVAFLVEKLAGLVGVSGYSSDAVFPPRLTQAGRILKAMAADLKASIGKSLILIGDNQPPEIHALGHLINHALGNFGQTIELLPRIDAGPVNQAASIAELVKDINAGLVETLVILGGNPAYDAPGNLDFAGALASDRVKQRIHLGLYHDETAALCHWHVPAAHALESWGDPLAFDGTATIQQPLIAPLFKGKTAHEIMALFLGDPSKSSLDLIREYWRNRLKAADFDTVWKTSLRDGVIVGTAYKPVPAAPRPLPGAKPIATVGDDVMELVFRPDPTVWDGRYANNGWLQELPKPLTNLTWGNALLVAPAVAERLGLRNENEGWADVAEVTIDGRSIRLPVLIAPGQAARTVTVHLGHGRRRAGKVGDGVGVDVGVLRTSANPWSVPGVKITKTGERARLALTHAHYNMEGRKLVRTATLAEYKEEPAFAQEGEHEGAGGESLFETPEPRRRHEAGEGNSWGMAINLNACIGCNACVVACQSENNIPVVGREQVLASREMHWLRIDRYFEGESIDDPKIDFQPVPCMQCEKAPCEIVCPVGATTHSVEGLNEMTYNRCVGTRYCSNNCPYKVRRFNFFHYALNTTHPTLKMLQNPDVTVRTRGVMEKCTYCVQRINGARIGAEIENRRVGGDEVTTACQGVCPTKAIVFGNLNDPEASVNKAKASPRNYALLSELNTRPRTTYLAKLRNPNPEIEAIARHASPRA